MLLVVCLFSAKSAAGQGVEPYGDYIIGGVSFVDGMGFQVGLLSARSLFSTELVVLSDLSPIFMKGARTSRVVFYPGISLRLLGLNRLVREAPYRGVDLDVGLRAGPGLSFSKRESRAERDRRFELVVEPFIRLVSARNRRWVFYSEIATSRPNLRLGLWIPY